MTGRDIPHIHSNKKALTGVAMTEGVEAFHRDLSQSSPPVRAMLRVENRAVDVCF